MSVVRYYSYETMANTRRTISSSMWREARFDAEQVERALGLPEAINTARGRSSGNRGDAKDHWARVLRVLETERQGK